MLKLIATYRYRHTRKDHEAAMMNNNTLKQRHMETWGRAAQAGARTMGMLREGYDRGDAEYQAAQSTLLAELAALVELSAQMDRAAGRLETIYARGAKSMIKACNVTQAEIESYRRSLAGQDVTQES